MIDVQSFSSIKKVHRKEKRSARYAATAIVDQMRMLSRNTLRFFRLRLLAPQRRSTPLGAMDDLA